VMVNDIWGATAVLHEPASRPRSVKARGNPRRRVRSRRRPFTLRMTAAIATAGIIAAVVWVTGFDRVVSHFQSRVTPPPVTAVPVDRAAIPLSDAPPSASAAREPTSTSTRPEVRAVKNASTLERPVPAVVKPLPAPAIVRQRPVVTPVVDSRPRPAVDSRTTAESSAPIEHRIPTERPARAERSYTDPGDGSAVIDWLLKDKR